MAQKKKKAPAEEEWNEGILFNSIPSHESLIEQSLLEAEKKQVRTEIHLGPVGNREEEVQTVVNDAEIAAKKHRRRRKEKKGNDGAKIDRRKLNQFISTSQI